MKLPADTKECHSFEYLSEDSIKILNTSFDTLFQISEKEVVKPYKGSLFFNIQEESEYWITLMLDENNSGHLELRLFHIEEPLLLSDFKGKYEVINDASFNEKLQVQEFFKTEFPSHFIKKSNTLYSHFN